MAFSVEVTFNGILSLCRHPDGSSIRILIPETLYGRYERAADDSSDVFKSAGHPPAALDSAHLARHYPRLNAGRDDTTPRLRYIRSEELIFDFHFEDVQQILEVQDLSPVPHMQTIVQGATIDPGAVSDPAASPLVTAHVDIKLGHLRCGPQEAWEVPTHLGTGDGKPRVECYATSLIWTIAGLKSASIRTVSYGTGQTKSWALGPTRGSAVDQVSIVNHCHEPWLPLPNPQPRQKDDDFRWHYQLLSQSAKTDVVKKLGGKASLPILYPVEPEEECPKAKTLEGTTRPSLDGAGHLVWDSPPFGNCVFARWF